jgi:hypothetical protein
VRALATRKPAAGCTRDCPTPSRHSGLFVPNPRVQLNIMDEPVVKIVKAHSAALKKSKSRSAPAPANLEDAVSAFERFLAAAFD